MLRALSFRSSIVPTILPVVAAATAWSALIVSLNKSDILRWTFEDKLISMLGVALAFLLAFRTNRAFDRYWQGAQLWTTLLIQTRNLARLIWNGIQTPTREHDAEKHQMMRMLLAVASTNDDADSELLPHYDAIDHGSANGVTTPPLVSAQSALSITSMDSALGAHGQEPMNRFPMYDQDGSLVINTPLDIIHRIGFYIRRQRQDRLADPDDVPSMTQAINTMIDSVTKFEQILNVPLPRSYDTHMKHILLMYFLWLPFQLVRSLGWTVVLVSCVVAFAYFGADAIAAEIDGPFGTEENDLPLDHFCQKLRGDIEYIMEAPLLSSDSPTLGKFWE
nr:hypothetical protein HK105_005153 [Polyrhizophydium stewartii]